METQPQNNPDKSIWNGVANIRLGGNFQIRWIRKKPISITQVQKELGDMVKNEIFFKSVDGCEVDLETFKKVSLFFEVPAQPYYIAEPPKKQIKPVSEEKANDMFTLNTTEGTKTPIMRI